MSPLLTSSISLLQSELKWSLLTSCSTLQRQKIISIWNAKSVVSYKIQFDIRKSKKIWVKTVHLSETHLFGNLNIRKGTFIIVKKWCVMSDMWWNFISLLSQWRNHWCLMKKSMKFSSLITHHTPPIHNREKTDVWWNKFKKIWIFFITHHPNICVSCVYCLSRPHFRLLGVFDSVDSENGIKFVM